MKLVFYAACALFSFLFMFLDSTTLFGAENGALYVALVFLTLWVPKKAPTIQVAVVCSILVMLGFLFDPSREITRLQVVPGFTFVPTPAANDLILVGQRVLSLALIWISTYLIIQKKKVDIRIINEMIFNRKLLKAMKENGVLPVCYLCKNTSNGECSFAEIKKYVSDHPGIKFSESICTDCNTCFCPKTPCSNREWCEKTD